MLHKTELREANAQRVAFYNFFDTHSNIKYAADNLSKPYLHHLSPGCRSCVSGKWFCIFITGVCNKACFYCPRERDGRPQDFPNTPENLILASKEKYIEYIKTFDFDGISFSGGEPFLAFDKMVAYIRETRLVFGSKHYVWAYTNGSLVTEERLRILKDAGLNELRFDISANEYELTPVEFAAKHIDTVTIEIPAIPEDKEFVKTNLEKFEAMGVKYLNLHQLMQTEFNQDAFHERGYTPVHHKYYKNHFPVVESELAGLEILKYAADQISEMGINYCSKCYKLRFQGNGHARRLASIFKDKMESVTSIGTLRRFSIQGSPEKLKHLKSVLDHKTGAESVFDKNDGRACLVVSPECIETILSFEPYHKIKISYFAIEKRESGPECKPDKHSLSFGTNTVSYQKEKLTEFDLANRTSAYFFLKLFRENKSIPQTAKDVMNYYNLPDSHQKGIVEEVQDFFNHFKNTEFSPTDMPDYDIE